MTHLIRGVLALSAVAVVVAVPVMGVTAQESDGSSPVETTQEGQANRYLEKAVTLEHDSLWLGAARLYEESAVLRTRGDDRARTAYERAGTLLFLGGRLEDARQMFVLAAESALRGGRVFEAADNYATTVELMALDGDCSGKDARGLVQMDLAVLLADSPLLTEEERATIRDRMDTFSRRRCRRA